MSPTDQEAEEHRETYRYFLQCLKARKIPTLEDFAAHIVADHEREDPNYYIKEGY